MWWQEKRHDRQLKQQQQQETALRGNLIPRSKAIVALDAEISSGETHPQPAMKADVAGGGVPAFPAPSKSGGSELFDALLMAATGAFITTPHFCLLKQDRTPALLPCDSLYIGHIHVCLWICFA